VTALRAPFLALLLWLAAAASPAAAQTCSFSITALNFGAVDILSGAADDVTATLSGSCGGGPSNGNIRVCPNIGSGAGGTDGAGVRQMLSGGNILKFQIYSNSGRTTVWGSYLWAFATRPPTLNVTLNSSGSGTLAATTLYGRVLANQTTAPPGSYSSSFAGHVAIRYRSGTNTCTATATGWQNATPSFTASATIAANCLVTASNVNFGSEGVIDAAIDAAGAVTVTCTMNNAYSIGLNGGLANAPPAARLMTLGAGTVTYGLYRDSARSLVWGSLAGSTVSGTGNGTATAHPVYGRVPAQTTPPPGTYSDTVVATVTY
jgi:spore coat protein U-like protein